VATTNASDATAASADPVLVVYRLVVVAALFGLLIAVARKLRREWSTGTSAAPPAPDAIAFAANVTRDFGPVGLRLVGSRDPLGRPYRWTNRPQPGPDQAGAWVCVGRDDRGYLFVDLAATPDLVTITGDPEARTRLGASFAEQIVRNGPDEADVSIVGDVVDPTALDGRGRFAADLAEFLSTGAQRVGRLTVVICTVASDAELDVLRELVRRTDHRLVAVVVGDLPPARWSFDAKPPDYVRVTTAADGTVSTTPSGPVTAKKVRSPTAADTSP
jgi:hypothetical protein